MDRSRRVTTAHLVSVLLVLAASAYAAVTVPDPDATGIIENGLGGPASAVLVGLSLLALPALAVGALDGRLSARTSTVARVVRDAVIVVLGLLAALWVIAATELECDGSCTSLPASTWVASTVLGLVVVVLSWWFGRILAPRPSRRPP